MPYPRQPTALRLFLEAVAILALLGVVCVLAIVRGG